MQGRGRRLALLGGLYSVQGVVQGFTAGVLVPSLAAAKVSVEAQTGLLALAGLPWVLKLPVAALLDRWGLRPGWVAAVALAAMALVVGSLGMLGVSPGRVGVLSGLWLVLNALLATQDVAADTIALDRVEPGERGLANGVMSGGHVLGAALLGSIALGAVAARTSLVGALWTLSGFLLLAALGTAAVCIGLPRATRGVPSGRSWSRVLPVLRSRTTWTVAGLAGIVFVADVATGAVGGEFLVNRLGWSVERISGTLAVTLLVGQALGYLVAAAVVDRLGHARAAAWGCWSLGALWAGFGFVPGAWSSLSFMLGFIVAQLVATGVLYVGLHAWLMDRVDPSVRATHYAVLTSLLNLPRAWVPRLAPVALGALAFEGLYVASGAFQIAVGFVVLLIARGATTRLNDAGLGPQARPESPSPEWASPE